MDARYQWDRPEILLQQYEYGRSIAPLLARTFGASPSAITVLDVGCGTGAFLRRLAHWRFAPTNLWGADLLEDRIDTARVSSPIGITWHVGDIDSLSKSGFDLVCANTVFSSVLSNEERRELARKMLGKTKSGGWLLVFDFRYNNPNNPHVRRLKKSELERYFTPVQSQYKTLHLAPPIARRLAPFSPLLCQLLTAFVPLLRSHFVLFMQKA